MFLLGSTWLAINVWLGEHGPLLAAIALAGVTWRPQVGRTSVGA